MTPLPAVGQLHNESVYYSNVEHKTEIPLLTIMPEIDVENQMTADRFFDEFPRAENAQWSNLRDLRKVAFTQDGLSIKAYYNQDGTFSYSMTHYPAELLPEEILRNVYLTYKRYKITSAKEVRVNKENSFYITLENGSNYKIIRIKNALIEQIGKLRKEVADREE